MRRSSPGPTFLVLVVLAVSFAASTAVAQTPPVVVERTGERVIEAEPGELVSAVFRLTNPSDRAVPVWAQAELPRGWRWVAPSGTSQLAAGASEVRVLGMQIPDTAAAGRYTIPYDVVSGWPTAPQVRNTVVVDVVERYAVALSLIESPRFVEAGTAYEARFRVGNLGNVVTRVALRLGGSRRFEARTDSGGVTLEPGGSRVVAVTVETDAELRRTLRHAVTLRAEAAGDTAVATSVVEVLARGRGPAPARRAFPVRLAVRATEPGGRAPPLELSGAGSLTRDGAVRMSFLLRGPDAGRSSLFGERDEYRLALRGRDFELLLGDRVYTQSLLTQPGRYGFGAGGRIGLGGLELGGFMLRDRRYGTGAAQRAAFLGYRLGDSRVRLNYNDADGLDGGRLWSGQGVLAPIRGLTLEAEYGIAGQTVGGARPDAYTIGLHAARARLALDARHMRVDPDYPGYYRGARQDYASVATTPWGELRLAASLNRYDREYAPGATRRNHTYQVDLAHNGNASLLLRSSRRSADGFGWTYDREERSARLRFGREIFGVRLWPEAEIGATEDRLTGETSPFLRYGLRTGFYGDGQSVSAWVDRFDGRTTFMAAPRAWVAAGLRASVRLGTRTRLRLSLSGRRYDDTDRWGTTVVDLAIEQGLPFGHSIFSRGRRVSHGASLLDPRTEALVEYIVPFEIPIGSGGARVGGRIYDAETGEALGGVPVRLGERTVLTDAQGRVEFNGVAPGVHYMTVDRRSAGIDRVPLTPLPLKVDVAPDERATVEIGLIRGARLSGTVRRFAFEEVLRQDAMPELVEAGGLANVVVEAESDGEVHRRLSDARGAFDFGSLRPGRWTIRVRAADLPAHHALEPARTVIELEPGVAEEVVLRVVPVRREIRIIDRSVVRADGAVENPPGLARTPPPPRWPVRRYRVGLDDIGLMQVARNVYRDASLWPKIWLANRARVPNPDLIRVGQALVIPPQAPLTFAERTARNAYYRGRSGTARSYTVRQGDVSLMQVARKVYGDASLWPKIWVANRATLADPDVIRPGQVLHIPARAPLTAEERAALRRYRERGR